MMKNNTGSRGTLIMLFLFLTTSLLSQKWYIGYPDSLSILAIQVNKTLVIQGTGEMKKHPCFNTWSNDILEVKIKEGVTNIGDRAFIECKKLERVSLPNSIEKIGQFAFKNCYNLKSIELSSSLMEIKANAFQNCILLVSISLPENMVKIGRYVFYGCAYLKHVQFGEKLESIGDYSFRGCKSLFDVCLPKSLKSLGQLPFMDCKGIQSYNIPASNHRYKTIDGVLFEKDTKRLLAYPAGRKGSYKVPEFVLSISSGAFRSSIVDDVLFSNSVTCIESDAFRYCSNLKSVVLPVNLKEISLLSFANCKSLEAVSIGDGTLSISRYAFSQSDKLTTFNISRTNPNFQSKKGLIYNKGKDTLIHCPNGRSGRLKIPKKTVFVQSYALCESTELGTVIIPRSIKGLGLMVFSDSYKLKEIVNKSRVPPKVSKESFYINMNRVKLIVRPKSLDFYKRDEIWGMFKQIEVLESCYK